MPGEMKTFTLEELARFDGHDGRPAYVAHDGKVYDVTASKLWKLGSHMKRHTAGLDLTVDLKQAPHGVDRLERFPVAGVVTEACAVERKDGREHELPWLLRKSPFLRRHPHPMTVHFPIAFATGAILCLALHLLTGSPMFEAAVHGMNFAGLLFTPVAILTGLATWKYNYGSSMILPIRIKLALSPVLLVQFAALCVWRLADPAALTGGGQAATVFAALTFSMLPVMGAVGWFGAGLTFPMHD
jgi:predicted heme/steroid binding protein/uncharacterized membrane protein